MVHAKGKGSSVFQLSYNYNVINNSGKPSFTLKPTVMNETTPKLLSLKVCAEYNPEELTANNMESNMAIMEIALPSGYVAVTEAFGETKKVDSVKHIETKNSDTRILVYFDGLKNGDEKCVPVMALREHAVAKQKPAAVTIYDYYDSRRQNTEYYEMKSSLCDICEDSQCLIECQNY